MSLSISNREFLTIFSELLLQYDTNPKVKFICHCVSATRITKCCFPNKESIRNKDLWSENNKIITRIEAYQ